MAVRLPNLLRLGTPVLVFAVVLGVLMLVNRGGGEAPERPAASEGVSSSGSSADDQVAQLQRQVRREPAKAGGYALLGDAYLQKARDTANPAFYSRAEGSFRAALQRAPRDATALVGAGTLALARHDFREGLRLGRRARAAAPDVVRPYSVLVDAQVELGRYAAAERDLQRMIDLRPNLASYSRVSYLRELRGDLPGAVEAMRLASSSGGATAENVAFVQTLLGDLELRRGRVSAATGAYRTALAGLPTHLPAQAGLARVDIARGRLRPAADRLARVTEQLPLPAFLVSAAEVELVLGRRARARSHLAQVRAQRRLLGAAGTRIDVDITLFEADHGSARRAVRYGRRVWSESPSVRSADALGWALTRAGRPREGLAWSRRSLKLGSRDASFRLHAGLSAAAAGQPAFAQRQLRSALRLDPALSPLQARRARRVLARLS